MKNLLLVVPTLFLISCAKPDAGRQQTPFESQFSGKYISTTDATRSLEYSSDGRVTYTGKCVFYDEFWYSVEVPHIGTGFYAAITGTRNGVSVPGFSNYCNPNLHPNCPTVAEICNNDKIYPYISMAGNCITAKDYDGSTEQFCK